MAALIAELSRLPGLGPRSAERIALHLLQTAPAEVQSLAQAILRARERIRDCEVCGGLTENSLCAICSDLRRDSAIVCLVERAVDILTIEKAGGFRGTYHVLGGRISPVNGVGPEDLRLNELEKRLGSGSIRELVVALPLDVEGDATSYYLAQRFASEAVRVTRIAQGLPSGSGLEFADEVTLSRALEGRRELT
jgi:recombination protein RecR